MDFSFPDIDWTPMSILFLIFLGSAGIQLLYILFIYIRFSIHSFKKNSQLSNDFPPVSVIIAARNEEDNLFHNLPKVLTQNYPEFEVIVVNHQSIDDSKHILQAFQNQHAHLKVIDIERNQHLRNGKKLPITMGIKGAKYDHFIFTDADCIPASDNWLRKMAGKFSDKKQLILGYGPYKKTKGFLNFLIRFDTASIAVNYFSYAKAGIPYMGVGRNMGYTRELFEGVHGFKNHYAIQSGDDDLFVKDVAKKRNYDIQYDTDAHCYSDAKSSWKKWVEQKQRHFTTAPSYRVFHKALLGTYPLTLLLTLFSFVTLIFSKEYWLWGCIVFGGLFILKWLIMGINYFKLGEKSSAGWFPFMEIIHTSIIPFIYYSSDNNEQQWK